MSVNTDSQGMSYALSILGIQGNPDLPVVENTRVWGGAWAVATLATRNLIPAALRKADVSTCYVTATDLTYILRGGIDNANWQPVASGGSSTLEVGNFEPDISFQVGVSSGFVLLDDLFKVVPGRTWSVASVRGLPPGVVFQSQTGNHGGIAGTPTAAGIYTIVINGVDSSGSRAQYVLPTVVSVAAPTVPVTVGSAALNIVMSNSAECSVVLTTGGFAETGLEAFAVANAMRRFIGGTDVDNSLALGSYGYTNVPGGIGYFSFAWAINLFRSRYPLATVANFDVFVHPSATDPDYVNRVNYSYHLSNGLQKVTLDNGLDYAYKDSAGSQGGFWHYDAGSASGQQNTSDNLHEQFTITGNAKKKIGVMTLNLLTGVSQFQPIAHSVVANNPPVVAAPFGNHTVNTAGSGLLNVPANTFSDTDALVLAITMQDGSPLISGLSYDNSGPGVNIIWSSTLANGVYPVKNVATDTAGQSVGDSWVLTINRDQSGTYVIDSSSPGIESGEDGAPGTPNDPLITT